MADQIDTQLKFAIKHGLNVCLAGKHGVGKTARVLDIFEDNKLNFKYFSAATMDPFTDFVGVPDKVVDADGNAKLTFLRPESLDADNVEAMFFDEYNRSPKKVRNAVMELIQFKSINGRKFPKLRYVWTAINPDDDEDNAYDVEIMDAAQSDRFHMHIDVPYNVSTSYFLSKYPNGQGKAAINWWNSLNKKQKNLVSPRRLDYATHQVANNNASSSILKTIYPKGINVKNFLEALHVGSFKDMLVMAYDNSDTAAAASLLNGSETSTAIKTIPDIMDDMNKGDSSKFFDFCETAMTDETLVNVVSDYAAPVRKTLSRKKHCKRLESLKEISSMSDDIKMRIDSIVGKPVVGSGASSNWSKANQRDRVTEWFGLD